MKILVVFYSKTGKTRQIGNEIAKLLKADVDEIVDLKNRKGIIGWIKSGRDEMKGYQTTIENQKDPNQYDLVIIGTPVWAWGSTPAARAYVIKFKDKLKKVAMFSTSGDTVAEKPKLVLEKILGKKISIYTGWTAAEIKDEKTYRKKKEDFVKELEMHNL